jgi:hypothetical protein
MRGFLKLFVLAAIIGVVLSVQAEEASGGLRYSITVTKFENSSGWIKQYDNSPALDRRKCHRNRGKSTFRILQPKGWDK